MRQVTNGEGAATKYPATFKLEPGKAVVFMATDRREAETQYGRKTVFTVTVKGDDTPVSLWWPKKLQEPDLLQPCRLTRVDEKRYRLDVPENDAERRSLWS